MQRHFLKATLFSFLFLCLPIATFAWSPFGHMVVASIAYQQLDPAVREKVDDMVGYLNKDYPEMDSFQQMATWPDALRMQRIETYTHWHYIDMPISTDGSALKDITDTDNAVWAVDNIETIVKNTHANWHERARFLSFLVHIVGDMHQPLHTVSNITANNPDGDKGGNLYFVRYNNERINLHKLWDGGLGAFTDTNTPEHVNTVAKNLMALYPASYFGKQVDDLNPADWTKEGMNNAKLYVYNTPEDGTPSTTYLSTGKQVAEQEAVLAGYRLAKLLNQLLA